MATVLEEELVGSVSVVGGDSSSSCCCWSSLVYAGIDGQ